MTSALALYTAVFGFFFVLFFFCCFVLFCFFVLFFHKGDNFCDFMFVFVHTRSLLKEIYSKRKEFFQGSKSFTLSGGIFSVFDTNISSENVSSPLKSDFRELISGKWELECAVPFRFNQRSVNTAKHYKSVVQCTIWIYHFEG